MSNTSQARITVYQEGRRTPMSARPPVFSAPILLGESVVLEEHITPKAAEYRERESDTHLLFLSDSEPVHATCRIGERRFDGQTQLGDVWLLPRLVPHSSVFEGPHGGLVLSISNSVLERHIGPLMRRGKIELGAQFNLKDRQLEYLMRGLLAMAREAGPADTLFADLLVNAICLRVAAKYAVSPLNVAPRLGGLSAAQLRRVLEYVSANLDKNIALSDLAHAANMSLFHFATSFKKTTGLSPHRYVLTQRIQRAEQLLRETPLSVLEVALKLGFGHQSNFARAFRRLNGVSPNIFRNHYLQRQLTERIEPSRKNR